MSIVHSKLYAAHCSDPGGVTLMTLSLTALVACIEALCAACAPEWTLCATARAARVNMPCTVTGAVPLARTTSTSQGALADRYSLTLPAITLRTIVAREGRVTVQHCDLCRVFDSQPA